MPTHFFGLGTQRNDNSKPICILVGPCELVLINAVMFKGEAPLVGRGIWQHVNLLCAPLPTLPRWSVERKLSIHQHHHHLRLWDAQISRNFYFAVPLRFGVYFVAAKPSSPWLSHLAYKTFHNKLLPYFSGLNFYRSPLVDCILSTSVSFSFLNTAALLDLRLLYMFFLCQECSSLDCLPDFIFKSRLTHQFLRDVVPCSPF